VPWHEDGTAATATPRVPKVCRDHNARVASAALEGDALPWRARVLRWFHRLPLFGAALTVGVALMTPMGKQADGLRCMAPVNPGQSAFWHLARRT
jgi:hypothetical protein